MGNLQRQGGYLEPGWEDQIGNYEFVAYAEDCGASEIRTDRFWLQTLDKDRMLVPSMSMDEPAFDNAIPLNSGNTVVPHRGK